MEDSTLPTGLEIKIDDLVIMRITADGFWFNREQFPKALADDFAQEFLNALQQNFDVKFEKRVKVDAAEQQVITDASV